MTAHPEMNLSCRWNLGDALRRSARRAPNQQAVIFYYTDERTESCTYGELNAKVNAVAHSLLRRGVRKGDRVAALSRNGIPFLILGYALHKIGAWLTSINFMLTPAEVAHLIRFSEAKWFFVEDALIKNLQDVIGDLPSVEQFVQFTLSGGVPPAGWIDFDELLGGSHLEPEVEIDSDDVATLFFTSGTESAPKGVLSTHHNYFAAQLAWSMNYGLTHDDRFLVSIPLIHMAGYVLSSLCLAHTITIIMTHQPHPAQMLELMARQRITATALPPTLYVAMLSSPSASGCDLSAATKFITWASTIPQAMIDGWNRLAPNLRFFSGQGSSESTAGIITGGYAGSWGEIPGRDGRWVGKLASCSADMMLVDEDGNEAPVGAPGEQIIRGPVVMKGYYRNDEANRRAFRDGWFCTGDVLFRDRDGNYFFADRKKDMIKSGGENVYCQEVESVIGAHPEVMLCAVFGLPDAHWGEAVTAAVIPRPGSRMTERDIIAFCRERLPGFKTPKYVFFRESLPISAANKILKRELKAEYSRNTAGA